MTFIFGPCRQCLPRCVWLLPHPIAPITMTGSPMVLGRLALLVTLSSLTWNLSGILLLTPLALAALKAFVP